MIHIVLWYWRGWRNIYTARHVNAAARAIAHFNPQARIVCVTNQQKVECETFPLWDDELQAAKQLSQRIDCFRRLRLFSTEQQRLLGITAGDVAYSCDIDSVFLGTLPSLASTSDFGAVRGFVAKYNGSLFAIRAGQMDYVYEQYLASGVAKIRKARRDGARLIGSDQAWMSLAIKDGQLWDRAEGVYVWPRMHRATPQLSSNAVLWTFPGAIKPWDSGCKKHTPWLHDAWSKHDQAK